VRFAVISLFDDHAFLLGHIKFKYGGWETWHYTLPFDLISENCI